MECNALSNTPRDAIADKPRPLEIGILAEPGDRTLQRHSGLASAGLPQLFLASHMAECLNRRTVSETG